MATAITLRRQRNLILTSLLLLAAGAWILLVWQAGRMGNASMGLTMGMNAVLFVGIWVVMMVAMMFPSAAPMILTFAQVQVGKRRQGQQAVGTWMFVAAYLLIWAAFGVLAYLLALGGDALGSNSGWLLDNGPRLAGLLLVAAGIFQLTPLKRVCLGKCRSPLAFIMTSWREGRAGALRMGVQHGLYCVGCCWLLFLILFPLGMMNIAALAAVTVLIFAEKTLVFGGRVGTLAAAVMIVYGLLVVLVPGALPSMQQPMPPSMNGM